MTIKVNTEKTITKSGYGLKTKSSLPGYDGIEIGKPDFIIPSLNFYLVKGSNGNWFIRFKGSTNALPATNVDVALWEIIAEQRRTIRKLKGNSSPLPIASKTK
jgi:hypothetical protein